MDHGLAMRTALDLMAQHGVSGAYHFRWMTKKRTKGQCVPPIDGRPGLIQLSRDYVALNDIDMVRNTILHEIAHAMVGCQHAHNNVWRRQFIAIGGDGSRTVSPNVKDSTKTYVLNCPKGHALGTKKGYRMPTAYTAKAKRQARCREHNVPGLYWTEA